MKQAEIKIICRRCGQETELELAAITKIECPAGYGQVCFEEGFCPISTQYTCRECEEGAKAEHLSSEEVKEVPHWRGTAYTSAGG